MQSVKWIGFGVSNALSRTVVHFFPSGGGVTAPYPANCMLNLFSLTVDESIGGLAHKLEEKKIVLEGARLSQPDGVRLDQAFEDLSQGVKGFFGITVELSTGQPKVDLSGSSCIIEHSSRANSLRYYPKPLFAPLLVQQTQPAPVLLAVEDALTLTTLVVVNGSALPFEPKLQMVGEAKKGSSQVDGRIQRAVHSEIVPAQSVVEVPIAGDSYSDLVPFEGAAGLIRAGGIYGETLPADIAVFALYRDLTTKRPISVCAL